MSETTSDPMTTAAQALRESRADASGGDPERLEVFARAIAHELKNPLGAARGAAEMLATGEGLASDEDRTRFAELVLRNINRALELLDDVRAMAGSPAPSDSEPTDRG